MLGGLALLLSFSSFSLADTVDIDVTLPEISTSQYKRPFLAVWVEAKGQREAQKTITVLFDDKKWLKDIRRWWRKGGRYNHDVDGVTGATKPPGVYRFTWDGRNQQGDKVPAGEYTLYVEAVREHGDRTLLKQRIVLGADTAQTYEVKAGDEVGPVTIKVQRN
ncbi:MAG: DUF2271 domain-containing protein [Pontibacterium sp.]